MVPLIFIGYEYLYDSDLREYISDTESACHMSDVLR